MADSAAAQADVLMEVLGGAPDDVERVVREALAAYAAPSRGPQEELVKASRLRVAFTELADWLLARRLPELNDAQWIFLSTGALGARADGVDLIPPAVYDALVKARAAKAARPGWAATILDVEDRVHAIARGELVAMDPAGSRRRKPARPLGADQLKEKVRSHAESLVAEVKAEIGGTEGAIAAFAALREEAVLKGAKLNVEAIRKYALLAGAPGTRNEQEQKFLASVGEKLNGLAASLAGLGGQLERAGRDLVSRAQALDGRLAELKGALDEMARLDSGQVSVEAGFDADTIAAIRRDEDTVASFAVKAAETADTKIPLSGSRILVKEHWRELGAPHECLATVPGVVAAIEKIAKVHVNVFPRDAAGQLLVPPIAIEPVRNFVEFFDDRIVLSFASGEQPRKGPKLSLTPLEVHVLKACGHWLCKDPIYDYRGEINAGTFIGDYSGRVEKKTQVKWTGEEKKMTLAISSQMVDAASRTDAVNDYVDCLFSLVNGQMPPQKISRRKVAVLLRYVVIESVERTVALLLQHCAPTELDETKTSILKHVKPESHARELVGRVCGDPAVTKLIGDKDYILTRLFGKLW